MKNFILFPGLCVLLGAFFGCAVAPISNPTTARSLGGGHVGVEAGIAAGSEGSSSGYKFAKLAVGVSENLDLMLQWETPTVGLALKYAILNPKEFGPAVALLGAYGASIGGNYYYAGPMASFKLGALEPFAIARFNYVKWDSSTWGNEGSILGTINVPSGSYNYLSFTGGTNFWFVPFFGIAADVTTFVGTSGDIKPSGAVFTGNLVFRI